MLVALDDFEMGRVAELAERLSRSVDRDVQVVRLGQGQSSFRLMVEVIEQGRVLVDRDDLWSGSQPSRVMSRRMARRAGRSFPVTAAERDLRDRTS